MAESAARPAERFSSPVIVVRAVSSIRPAAPLAITSAQPATVSVMGIAGAKDGASVVVTMVAIGVSSRYAALTVAIVTRAAAAFAAALFPSTVVLVEPPPVEHDVSVKSTTPAIIVRQNKFLRPT